jgi:hypothetical protein
MAESVDDLTVEWEEGGDKVVREVAKEVISRGAWATVVFLCQDLDRKSRTYRAPKISIRRYKKVNGQYRYQSKFNISSENQAHQLVDVISKWFTDGGAGKNATSVPRPGDLTSTPGQAPTSEPAGGNEHDPDEHAE